MRINNEVLFSSADSSVSQTSPALLLEHVVNFAIQVVFTGAPSGTLKLQASCDYGRPDASFNISSQVTNWGDITGSSTVVATAGTITYNFEDCGFTWVRLVWTPTGSVGTLSAKFNSKGA